MGIMGEGKGDGERREKERKLNSSKKQLKK